MAKGKGKPDIKALLSRGGPSAPIDRIVRLRIQLFRKDEFGWSQEELAGRMSDLGFPWTQSTIAAIEVGKRRVTLGELVGLALLFAHPLEDFLLFAKGSQGGHSWVQIGEKTELTSAALWHVIRGRKPLLDSAAVSVRGKEIDFEKAFASYTALQEDQEDVFVALVDLLEVDSQQVLAAISGQSETVIGNILAERERVPAPEYGFMLAAAIALHLWGHSASEEFTRRRKGRRKDERALVHEMADEIDAVLREKIPAARRIAEKAPSGQLTRARRGGKK